MYKLLDLDNKKICIQSTNGSGEFAKKVEKLLLQNKDRSTNEVYSLSDKACQKTCQKCPQNAALIIIIWCDHQNDFQPGKYLEDRFFPPDSKDKKTDSKEPVPVLSLLFTPLVFLHNNSDLLNLDHRIGVLDHSVWHRALTIPEDIKKLQSTVTYMLNDPRYKTIVASEALLDLKDRYQYQVRVNNTFYKRHADTYKRKFIPRACIRGDIENLLKNFSTPDEEDKKNKRAICMIDDHCDGLNQLSDGKPFEFGKKHACLRALKESFLYKDDFKEYKDTQDKNDSGWESLKNEIFNNDKRNPFTHWEWVKDYKGIRSFIEDSDIKNKLIEPIILLDFLFSDRPEGDEYLFGTSLITELSNSAIVTDDGAGNKNETETIIDKPFSIFFISSFPWGVIEESKRGTTPLHTGNLFIDLGEDPVCYPELFVKKLLQFILSREIRPLMNACETIKEADKILNSLLPEKANNNPSMDYSLIFNEIGVLYSYLKKLEGLQNYSLLDRQTVRLMKFKPDAATYKEIYKCLSRFLHGGPEDCRLVAMKLKKWEYFDLKNNDEGIVSQDLKGKLNLLKKNVLEKLKQQMEYF